MRTILYLIDCGQLRRKMHAFTYNCASTVLMHHGLTFCSNSTCTTLLLYYNTKQKIKDILNKCISVVNDSDKEC